MSFEPSSDQAIALNAIEQFLSDPSDFLVLNGAAGTGKTSIMKAVVDYLKHTPTYYVQLLAPTGSAANNISEKANKSASTLHSFMYTLEIDIDEAIYYFREKTLDLNGQDMLFIVDESSMLSDFRNNSEDFKSTNSLLYDVIQYVKMGNNKILFIGDSCQLLPFGYNSLQLPPALDPVYLYQKHGLEGNSIAINAIQRQSARSYILTAALNLRQKIGNNDRRGYRADIGQRVYNFNDAIDTYLNYYDHNNPQAVCLISYAKSYVAKSNLAIRNRLGKTDIINVGDKVYINQNAVINNISISNGEMGEIVALGKQSKVAEQRFIHVVIGIKNFDNEINYVETEISLDYLINPDLISHEMKKALFAIAYKNNSTFRASKNPADDIYLSALRVSYGHALTCHKAQGSEWSTVILNSWYPPNTDLRFLYTAVSRARDKLYCTNAHTFG